MCKTMVYQRHSVKNPVEYLISNFLVLLNVEVKFLDILE